VLVFGSEGSGLPGKIMNSGRGETVRIPMLGERRSLNLSNAVSIALYEALRQGGTYSDA
jgi:tRNA (cytidine/uridine-2'-O-)-methyltransferase